MGATPTQSFGHRMASDELPLARTSGGVRRVVRYALPLPRVAASATTSIAALGTISTPEARLSSFLSSGLLLTLLFDGAVPATVEEKATIVARLWETDSKNVNASARLTSESEKAAAR